MNLSFFTKHDATNPRINFSFLGTDFHSHLIPGIDDGSPDMETSLHLMGVLKELGFSKIITTPHINENYSGNDEEVIRSGKQLVQQELIMKRMHIDFKAAAEYMLEPRLLEKIEKNEPLLPVSGNKILLEFPLLLLPLRLDDLIFQIRSKGYSLIIAHPERYQYLHNNPDYYKKLSDSECELQANLLSFTGFYGKAVKRAAFRLLEQKQLSYLATDLHNIHYANALKKMLTDTGLMKKLISYEWKNASL